MTKFGQNHIDYWPNLVNNMTYMVFRQNIDFLKSWAFSKHRKPLVLRGARQTGKSTLVRMLTKALQLNLIEINFEEITFNSLEKKTINIHALINDIELMMGRKINSNTDLIFFDEIQKSPHALMSLRYFYEKYPKIKIIAAGSLLDFLLNEESVSFPVGRIDFYHIGPLTFYEFVRATQNQILIEAIHKPLDQITESEHLKLIDLWRMYSFVGGMPEAVATYFNNPTDLFAIRKIQNSLLNTYRADILKYSKKSESVRCDKVLTYVPSRMGEKVKYSEIDEHEKSRDLKIAVDLLIKARVILNCRHTNATATPLEATADDRIFKLYFLDIGLANAATSVSIQDLTAKDLSYKGKIAEQMIAQNLILKNPEMDEKLFYCLQDKSSAKSEVDFIIHKDRQIIPIEVKSGVKIKSKSLFIFNQHHPKSKLSLFFSENSYRSQKKDTTTILYLPLYAVHKLNEII